jgi:hypothetical protein
VRDANDIEVILGKFATARFVPSGDVVRRAFAEHGIALPRDVLSEVKKRNYPVHGFLMNRDLDHDLASTYGDWKLFKRSWWV